MLDTLFIDDAGKSSTHDWFMTLGPRYDASPGPPMHHQHQLASALFYRMFSLIFHWWIYHFMTIDSRHCTFVWWGFGFWFCIFLLFFWLMPRLNIRPRQAQIHLRLLIFALIIFKIRYFDFAIPLPSSYKISPQSLILLYLDDIYDFGQRTAITPLNGSYQHSMPFA
jgi:hypothetical protein